ncbi:restriction endonuclease subunit S [Acaryochloris sp. CCMEE 5410]|uniref:restriction endonuclease subunit S n=1 Tax=Acaryochloris sp. CCMEE 5410 TaxID=310037 RepID=UPI0021D0BF88|nr:restriction endonuclease subunit S [Acaryochloris sp. CCMEE 5410]
MIAEAPGGVQRLRELILDLAVRGQLVPQDPADEPADKLLQYIAAERKQLIKDKKISNLKRQKSHSFEECIHSLPQNWIEAPASELCLLVTDGDHQPPPKVEHGIPFLVIGNVSKGKLDFSSTRFTTHDYFENLDWGKKPQKGDILYTVTGSYGITILVKTERKFCVQRHIAILRTSENLSARYLQIALSSPKCKQDASHVATGIAQKTVPLSGLRALPIPLPPLAEQKRIVAKVDELMALCDRYEVSKCDRNTLRTKMQASAIDALMNVETDESLNTAWEFVRENWECLSQQPEEIESLRKLILEVALRGRLLQNTHEFIDQQSIPVKLPKSWQCLQMNTLICEPLRNGRSVRDRKGGFPVLRLSALRGTYLNCDDFKEGDWTEEQAEAWKVRKNDYFVARGNGSIHLVGRGALMPQEPKNPVAFPDTMIRVRIQDKLLTSSFFQYVWDSLYVRQQIEASAKTTSGLFKVSQGDIQNVWIGVPSLIEQKRIVAKVDQLMTLCDTLENHLHETQGKATALAAAVVGQLEV